MLFLFFSFGAVFIPSIFFSWGIPPIKLVKVRSLGESFSGKYPYFCRYLNFLISPSQCGTGRKKTCMSKKPISIRPYLSIEHRLVTDTDTERQTDTGTHNETDTAVVPAQAQCRAGTKLKMPAQASSIGGIERRNAKQCLAVTVNVRRRSLGVAELWNRLFFGRSAQGHAPDSITSQAINTIGDRRRRQGLFNQTANLRNIVTRIITTSCHGTGSPRPHRWCSGANKTHDIHSCTFGTCPSLSITPRSGPKKGR